MYFFSGVSKIRGHEYWAFACLGTHIFLPPSLMILWFKGKGRKKEEEEGG